VKPDGKNGRASLGFFLLSVCTDAESLDQFPRVVHEMKFLSLSQGVFRGRLLVH
jgi:hypothetical protein